MGDEPTEAEFRAAGFTAAAIEYPLSDAAFRWLCDFNGISPDQAPRAWKYAPNELMREYLEKKAND